MSVILCPLVVALLWAGGWGVAPGKGRGRGGRKGKGGRRGEENGNAKVGAIFKICFPDFLVLGRERWVRWDGWMDGWMRGACAGSLELGGFRGIYSDWREGIFYPSRGCAVKGEGSGG